MTSCRRGRRGLAPLAAALLLLTACTPSRVAAIHAHMTVSPSRALLDEPIQVRVSGLPGGSSVRITASANDYDRKAWQSTATFIAPSDGVVSLDQAPKSGSYTGANPLGLLMFMTPKSTSSEETEFVQPYVGFSVHFTATVDGHTVASGQTYRVGKATGTTVRHLSPAKDGVYGDLFTPPHPSGKRPAVLMFGGSEGGESPFPAAQLLADRGYPTLALAYFKEPGLPQTLSDIPLEYFAHALRILRAQPDVDPKHVLVFGVSRGGEAAMLVGSTYPNLVNGVIGGVPGWDVEISFPAGSGYAWTLHGHRLDPGTPIAVEHIRGPILEACGGEDTTWASCDNVDKIDTRLRQYHFRYPVTALRYPKAGHTSGQLYCCDSYTPGAYIDHGGTLIANQNAAVAGHRRLLSFLASLSAEH